jgi:peptide/nickel transport system permease protein
VHIYAIRRTLQLLPVLFMVAIVIFLLMRAVPGDPAMAILGTDATPAQVEQLRLLMGLDQPLHLQFVEWFGSVLKGDLGVSIISKKPVAQSLMERIPVTVGLTVIATLISLAIAVPAGVLAAVFQNRWPDQVVMGLALLGICIPSFWLGLIFLILFSVNLRWFPLTGYVPFSVDFVEAVRHVALPALAMGLVQAGVVTRMTRATLLEVLNLDFIRTARAKGLAERVVIFRHALKNAMIPIITVIGFNIGVLLGGTVAIESIFGIPGVGRYILAAIFSRDYPAVQASLLLVTTVFVLINLLVDLTYALFDPRIRYS